MKLSIIIPAKDEEKRIGRTLEEYSSFFGKIPNLDYEILVMINNTTDNTKGVVNQIAKKNNNLKCFELPGKGKRYAIMEGFKEALKSDGDLIGFVDADLATPSESFFRLIESMNGKDVAIASRAHPESVVRTSLKRKIFSVGFNFGVRALLQLPIKDTQCGAKLFTRQAVKEILKDPPYSQWAFDVEVLYDLRKKKFSISEVPTVWEDKANSKLNLKKVPLQMGLGVLRLRIINSPFRGFMRIYDWTEIK